MEKEELTNTFIGKVAVALWGFMRAASLKVKLGRRDSLSFIYQISDLTENAEVIGLSFVLDLAFLAQFNVEETEESIEKLCYAVTYDLGCQLFKAKCEKILHFGEKKSKIILPGE